MSTDATFQQVPADAGLSFQDVQEPVAVSTQPAPAAVVPDTTENAASTAPTGTYRPRAAISPHRAKRAAHRFIAGALQDAYNDILAKLSAQYDNEEIREAIAAQVRAEMDIHEVRSL